MAHCMVTFGMVSRFAPVARLSLGPLGKWPLIGEVEVCPGPNLVGQWCPVLGNQADLFFPSHWGDSGDPEAMVLGVRWTTWWKALLPAGTGQWAGRALICAAQEEAPLGSVAGVRMMWPPDPRERKEIPKRLLESRVSGSLIHVISFLPSCDPTSGSSRWNMLEKASSYPSHLP